MSFSKQVHMPIGTLEEIKALGMDPLKVACCHAEVKGSIKGCPYESACQFDRKVLGGFKGNGPRYVGFHLRTSHSDGGKQIENYAPCYRFVAALQARMLVGLARRNARQDHELIQIVAQEGDEIVVREWKAVAADGGNRSKNYKMKGETVELKVPKFPRPGENPGVTYDDKLNARAAERERRMQELEDALFEQAVAVRETAEVGDTVIDDGEIPVLSGAPAAESEVTVPAAEPVKPKKR